MSRITVTCHRCGEPTFVDLSKTVSGQRCHSCRGFLQGVDVTIGGKAPKVRRRQVWKSLWNRRKDAAVWSDGDEQVNPRAKRWPRFFRWTIGICIVAVLSAIGVSTYLNYLRTRGDRIVVPGQEAPVQLDVRETQAWGKPATEAARRVLTATTVEDLLPLLTHAGIPDELIHHYYSSEETLPIGGHLNERYILPAGEAKERSVAFTFVDGGGRPRALAVVEKPGGMKIDWACLTGYGEMTLGEYMKMKPSRHVVMRVLARTGGYYNGVFSDAGRWLCARIASPAGEEIMYGYAEYDSALGEQLERLPEPGAGIDKPLVVILKYPEGKATADQVQIVARVATTWYQPEGLGRFIEMARKLDAGTIPDELKLIPDKKAAPKEDTTAITSPP